MSEPTIAEQVQEEQAARIRWLLERATNEVRLEFTGYAMAHPFPSEDAHHFYDADCPCDDCVATGQDPEPDPEPGGATSAWEHHRHG